MKKGVSSSLVDSFPLEMTNSTELLLLELDKNLNNLLAGLAFLPSESESKDECEVEQNVCTPHHPQYENTVRRSYGGALVIEDYKADHSPTAPKKCTY